MAQVWRENHEAPHHTQGQTVFGHILPSCIMDGAWGTQHRAQPLGTSLSSSKQEHHTSSKEEQEQALKKMCKPWPSLAAGLSISKARLEVGME